VKLIRYCNIHAVVDDYFLHFMANDDRKEAINLVTRTVESVNKVLILGVSHRVKGRWPLHSHDTKSVASNKHYGGGVRWRVKFESLKS